jgi:hypothetical protein
MEKAAPRSEPSVSRKCSGVRILSTTIASRSPGNPCSFSRIRTIWSRRRGPSAIQSIRPSKCGTGASTYRTSPPGGASPESVLLGA